MSEALTLQRLNMDTTWLLHWSGRSLLLDPWLVGPEIDGFSWFNKQYHATEPVPLEELPAYDDIIISQSYADHCHLETLRALRQKAILATPKAHAKLSKQSDMRADLTPLPDLCQGELLALGDLKIGYLAPDRYIDPVYYALVIAKGKDALFYASHGFHLLPKHQEVLSSYSIQVLITTFTHFQLPSFLGGLVNPGLPNARALIEQLQPAHVLNTHDEEKHGSGLVGRIAKVIYPDTDALSADPAYSLTQVNDYQSRAFSLRS